MSLVPKEPRTVEIAAHAPERNKAAIRSMRLSFMILMTIATATGCSNSGPTKNKELRLHMGNEEYSYPSMQSGGHG
jgi:hypothetical protein